MSPSLFLLLALYVGFTCLSNTEAFQQSLSQKYALCRASRVNKKSSFCLNANTEQNYKSNTRGWNQRRSLLKYTEMSFLSIFVGFTYRPLASYADFAPGGTLVEFDVGVTVGNQDASKSRKNDNSNVVFTQDYYYKFGTAAPWIENGSTDFPKTMPFTPSQQRYDTMKKYRERVQRGLDLIASIGESIRKDEYAGIQDSSAPEYSIRPMGLMANGFLASENTGTTNELLLARWYINEIFLDINDIKTASTKEDALQSYSAAVKAVDSYLTLLNRVITSKVGDKFDLL